MNKRELIKGIAETVAKKHPWRIDQVKYLELFGELPREFLEERAAYDAVVEKSKTFKRCNLFLTNVKIEVKITLDELIQWELSLDRWLDARNHNILPTDIKKALKEYNLLNNEIK